MISTTPVVGRAMPCRSEPSINLIDHCSSPSDSGQKPEQGIVVHPSSTIAGLGLRAADGADRSKIGRQLPPALAWTADCHSPRRDLWRSSQTPRLTTSGGVESQWAWQAAAECPARLAESCQRSMSTCSSTSTDRVGQCVTGLATH